MEIHQIYGIIKLNSKIIYGMKKNGSVMREFISIYPKTDKMILVSTKKQFQINNMYCLCKVETIKDNIYYASILEYFGDIGNLNNELEFTKRLLSSDWNKIYYLHELNDDLNITINKNIYSIDPFGCIDIDDALHIEEYNDCYKIYIHIADVSSYIKENTDLDMEISKRAESIYLPNKTIHMLPDNLMKICSLTQNKISKVVSVVLTILKDTYEIIKYEIQRNNIQPINLSYEQADELKETNQDIKNLYDIGNKLNNDKFNLINYDIHKMVEIYMILANHYVAEIIKFNKQYLLRIHNGVSHKTLSDDPIKMLSDDPIKTLSDDPIIEKFKNINIEKAQYILCTQEYQGNKLHKMFTNNGLIYTHFTSPIRRYADIIVHRMLFDEIKLDNNIIDNINFKHSHYQKYERLTENLIKIYQLKDSSFETSAIIISLEPFIIYIKSLDLMIYHHIISDKIKDLFEIINNDNNLQIINKNNDVIQFELFQKIKIIISITLNKWNKVNIQIIEPYVNILFYDDY